MLQNTTINKSMSREHTHTHNRKNSFALSQSNHESSKNSSQVFDRKRERKNQQRNNILSQNHIEFMLNFSELYGRVQKNESDSVCDSINGLRQPCVSCIALVWKYPFTLLKWKNIEFGMHLNWIAASHWISIILHWRYCWI